MRSMETLDNLLDTLADFSARYGPPPPHPLRVSDGMLERLRAACLSHVQNADLKLLLPETVFGLQIVVDDSVPENRVGYLDAEGNLRLI